MPIGHLYLSSLSGELRHFPGQLMIYLFFVLKFLLLIKGASWLAESGSLIASSYGVSKMVIGLTTVTFRTSLPILNVNILASFADNSDMVIGNIFVEGSKTKYPFFYSMKGGLK